MTIDLSTIYAFMELPMDQQLLRFLINFGWIPIAAVIIVGAKELWVDYIQGQWASKQKFVLLAIDIQKGNEQSIKAVENMFIYFAGAHGSINLIEKWWDGKFQLGFSFEIVSIEGYTQFLIRTPDSWRNLTETAVYSQYPDAEITEVNDYTVGMPTRFPNDEYDIWGSEFIYSDNPAYPIKVYKEFEDKAASRPEHLFKDPMASLMDLCSSLGPGEQLWYQILVKPIDFKWAAELNKEVSKLLNEKVKAKEGPIGKIFSQIKGWIDEFTTQVFSWSMGSFEKAEKTDDALKMMNLKPQQKKKIEAIQAKASKIGFEAKNRMIYIARKEVKNNPKVVNGFVGYLKQFTDIDLNGLKPDSDRTATSTAYFFKDVRLNTRKNKIMNAYRTRDIWLGRVPKVFNVEELATLWHFPLEAVVKAPLIQKAPGRKAEPPISLPLADGAVDESSFIGSEDDDIFSESALESETVRPHADGSERPSSDKKEETLDEIFRVDDVDSDDHGQVKRISTVPPPPKGAAPANLPFV